MAKKKLSTIASNPLVVNTTSYSAISYNGYRTTSGRATVTNNISGVTTTPGIAYTIYNPVKSKYIVLDKEIEVLGNKDFNTSSCIALINTLGIKFYIELKKQDVRFPKEIEDFLEKEIVSYHRNSTIDEIMK